MRCERFVVFVLEIVAMSALSKLPSVMTVLLEGKTARAAQLALGLPLSWFAHHVLHVDRVSSLFAFVSQNGRFSVAAKARSYYYYWRYSFFN